MADYSFGTLAHSDTSYDTAHPWIGTVDTVSLNPRYRYSYATVDLTLNKRCAVSKVAFKGHSASGQNRTYQLTLNGNTYGSDTKPTQTGSNQPLTFKPDVTLNAGTYTLKVECTDSNVGYMGLDAADVFRVDTSNCTIVSAAPTVKVWNGSAWKTATAVKVWNGSAWKEATEMKVWNGSQWKTADG